MTSSRCVSFASVLLLVPIGCGNDDAPGGTAGTFGTDSDADESTTSDETATLTTTTGADDSTSSTTTGPGSPTETTSAAECRADDECTDADAPICSEGRCVGCDEVDGSPDAACAAKDPDAALCVSGECVECTPERASACGGIEPICDPDTNACVGCSYHEDCPQSACRIAEGDCLPDDTVWLVDAEADCDASEGTPALPFCTLGEALEQLGPGQSGTIVVRPATYAETIEVTGGRTIALLAESTGSSRPRINRVGAEPLIRVGGAASSLYLDGFILQGNSEGPGLSVNEGLAYLDATQIVSNAGSGVEITGGGHVQLRNTIIGRNGDEFSATHGLVVEGSTFAMLYGSLVANEGQGDDDSLTCDATSSGTVRNSIVVGADLESIACSELEVTTSSVDTPGLGGEGNDLLETFEASWFRGVGTGDFHLADPVDTPFAEVARWRTGDPSRDLDGEPRPTRDGTADYAGADVP